MRDELICQFVVPGPPVPKGRPRVFYDKAHQRFRAATPGKTAEAEQRIAQHFWFNYRRRELLTGRLRMTLRFYIDNFRRVDADNLEKTVKDALNGKAYVDDSQIDETNVRVVRGVPNPRTEVEIWRLGEDARTR